MIRRIITQLRIEWESLPACSCLCLIVAMLLMLILEMTAFIWFPPLCCLCTWLSIHP